MSALAAAWEASATDRQTGISRLDRQRARAWRERMRPHFDALYGPEPPRSDTREAERGRTFAARWRREQPHKAMLDRLYGAEC